MSSGSSNSGVPGGLAPIGGWKADEGPAATPTPSVPPTVSTPPIQTPSPAGMANVGGTTASAPAPPGNTGASRFDTPPPPPPGAPRSRFDVVPPVASSRFNTPAASPTPKLALPEPQRERAYSVAGAYQKGDVPEMSSGQIAAGIAAGIIVGGVCTGLWIAFFLFTGFRLSTYIAPAIGYAIGWAVFNATKYGEETSCWISGAISAVYSVMGVGLIQYLLYKAYGFPNIIGIFFGIIAIGLAAERGYRTPEIMAVNTHV